MPLPAAAVAAIPSVLGGIGSLIGNKKKPFVLYEDVRTTTQG